MHMFPLAIFPVTPPSSSRTCSTPGTSSSTATSYGRRLQTGPTLEVSFDDAAGCVCVCVCVCGVCVCVCVWCVCVCVVCVCVWCVWCVCVL